MLLLLGSICIGNQSAAQDADLTDTNTESQTDQELPLYNEVGLSFTQINEINTALESGIRQMLSRLKQEGGGEIKTPRVLLQGYPETMSLTDRYIWIVHGLQTDDIATLLWVFRTDGIEPEYYWTDEGRLVFTSTWFSTPEYRLATAVRTNDITQMQQIIDAGDVNLEFYLRRLQPTTEEERLQRLIDIGSSAYYTNSSRKTPLMQAVSDSNQTAVELLLKAGANPNIGDAVTPLQIALEKGDIQILEQLLKADVYTDGLMRGTELSPVAWAMELGTPDQLKLLKRYGVSQDLPDAEGWTPLMDALLAGDIETATGLISVSDPLATSTVPLSATQPLSHLAARIAPGRSWFPVTNELYLAWQLESPYREQISDALMARARESDDPEITKLMQMRAWNSASDDRFAQGDVSGAIDALRNSLRLAKPESLEIDSDGGSIELSMNQLTRLHEMLLMIDQSPTEAEYAGVSHITELGGWHQKLHDMLEAVELAKKEYPSELLLAWRQAHGNPSHSDWDYTRLNEWIETVQDERVRDRLFDTMDFFEMNYLKP
ncbi:hypothetical protein OAM69_01995 [bacterium]|nr:hypothetical protein [bacterium]